jgi:hypothetical protein
MGDFISEFKANVRHFIADNPIDPDYLDYPHVMYVDVLPVLAYIDQLDRDGGLTSAVSDKLRSLIKGLHHDLA